MKRAVAIGAMLAVQAVAPAFAVEPDNGALRAYCTAEFPTKPGVCDCLDTQFGKLNEPQRAYLGATLRNDQAVLPALRAALTADELKQADGFLARETLLCQPSG